MTASLPEIVMHIVGYYNKRDLNALPDGVRDVAIKCEERCNHNFFTVCSNLVQWWGGEMSVLPAFMEWQKKSVKFNESYPWCVSLNEFISGCSDLSDLIMLDGSEFKFRHEVKWGLKRLIKYYVRKNQKSPVRHATYRAERTKDGV